eukprot:m51a1_g4030 hypothetical protein (1766) ;mRNA; r:644932-651930
MLSKTIRRDAGNVLVAAAGLKQSKQQPLMQEYEALILLHREVRREIDQYTFEGHILIPPYASYGDEAPKKPPHSEELSRGLDNKCTEIMVVATSKAKILADMDASLRVFKDRINLLTDDAIRQLGLEHSSGGNVRLEVGTSSDEWVTHCAALVNSRLFSADFECLGNPRSRILRISRVQNTHLQSLFQTSVAAMSGESAPGKPPRSPPQFDYVFSCSTSRDDALRVIQDGFERSEVPIRLSNSVALSIAPAMEQLQASRGIVQIHIVVIKGLLGRMSTDTAVAGTPPPPKAMPDVDTLCRHKAGDAKQREFLAWRRRALLPEFLVELELIPESQTCTDIGSLLMNAEQEPGTPEPKILMDALDRVLQKLANLFDPKTTSSTCGSLRQSEPEIRRRAPMAAVESFTSITRVDLTGAGLSKVDMLAPLQSVQVITLAFNQLRNMEGFSDFKSLETLDLSFNLLKRADCKRTMSSLKTLSLEHNQIACSDDLYSLKHNPVCENQWYKPIVVRTLPGITTLDEVAISQSMKDALMAESGQSSAIVMRDDGVVDVSGRSIRNLQVILDRIVSHPDVKLLDASRNQLPSLEGVEQLSELRELHVEENRLKDLGSVHNLMKLHRLDAGYNRIAAIDFPNGCLPFLVQLSIEGNFLTTLSPFQNLACLQELYCSNNKIASLREVVYLKDLQKLCVVDLSGNPLCKTVDTVSEYRGYILHRLQRLRVLDGEQVTQEESAAAASQFLGRLNADFLEEVVGHRQFHRIDSLDLTGRRMKSIGRLVGDEDMSLVGLRELILDNNLLTEIDPVFALKTLQTLRAVGNKIEYVRPDSCAVCNSVAITCASLMTVDLSHNKIRRIASLHFHQAPHLRKLILTDNELATVDGLESCISLEELELDKNCIKSFDDRSFCSQLNLTVLSIQDNGLRSLNFLTLPKLRLLKIATNRILEVAEFDPAQPAPAPPPRPHSPAAGDVLLEKPPVSPRGAEAAAAPEDAGHAAEVASQLQSPVLVAACAFNAVCCALGGFFCFGVLFSGMLSSFFDLFDDVYRRSEGRSYLASLGCIVLSSALAVVLLPYAVHYTTSVLVGKGAYDLRRRLSPGTGPACLLVADLVSNAYYAGTLGGSVVFAVAQGAAYEPYSYVQYAVIWNSVAHASIVGFLAVTDVALWAVATAIWAFSGLERFRARARDCFTAMEQYKFEVRPAYVVTPARQANCLCVAARKSGVLGLVGIALCDAALAAAGMYFVVVDDVSRYVLPVAVLAFIYDVSLDRHLRKYEVPPVGVRVLHHLTRVVLVLVCVAAVAATFRPLANDAQQHNGVVALSAFVSIYVVVVVFAHELLLLRYDGLWPVCRQLSRRWYWRVSKWILLLTCGLVFLGAGTGLLQLLGAIPEGKEGATGFVAVFGLILLGVGAVCVGALALKVWTELRKYREGSDEEEEDNPFDSVFILAQRTGLVIAVAATIFALFALFIVVFLSKVPPGDTANTAVANASRPVVRTLPELPICRWRFTEQNISVIDAGFFIDIAYYPEETAREMLATWFGGSWELFNPADANISTEYSQWYEFRRNRTCVLAIRGTSNDFDVLRDADIWLQSLIVRVLQTFVPGFGLLPFSLSRSFVDMSSWPWRDESYHYSSIVEYIDAYPCDDRLIVGHSLGGGLAQIVSTISRIPSVTFSPPGSLYSSVKLGIDNTENIKRLAHYLVSVIPDKDVVPMVDVQKGHIVTIPCLSGNIASCHSTIRTSCYLLNSCGEPSGRTFAQTEECDTAATPETLQHSEV